MAGGNDNTGEAIELPDGKREHRSRSQFVEETGFNTVGTED